ncbi:MAG: rubredoxin [Eubacteriales bacterium]|nr:rubredoxin [Eubacteriales bacterium]
MRKFVCSICGFIYDEAAGIPEAGYAAGTLWEQLPDDWRCPWCRAAKSEFRLQDASPAPAAASAQPAVATIRTQSTTSGELSAAALGALFTNLAKGCEKQYRPEESQLFAELATYYHAQAPKPEPAILSALADMNNSQLAGAFAAAYAQASELADRGTLRALTWAEKVARMQNGHLAQFQQQPEAIAAAKTYVCEICGFIYIGDDAPEICPVCKVPRLKIAAVARR